MITPTKALGFTLLELVALTALAGIAIGTVTLNMHGLSEGAHFRSVADQVCSIHGLAQAQASRVGLLVWMRFEPGHCELSWPVHRQGSWSRGAPSRFTLEDGFRVLADPACSTLASGAESHAEIAVLPGWSPTPVTLCLMGRGSFKAKLVLGGEAGCRVTNEDNHRENS